MKISYRGIGLESIFLMFQQPWKHDIDMVHDNASDCGKTTHTTYDMVECFFLKNYKNKAYVPAMLNFVPSCGQVG